MRATVCLPTYDERANLEPMLRALGDVLRDGDRVLVIDDNSPDGTGELADRLAAELTFVSVLHRPREGGPRPRVPRRLRRALDDGAELVLEMDCDFSHDPADVPRLIAAVEDGADLVIGSRYVQGGQVGSWGLVRRAISRGGLDLHGALPAARGQGSDRRASSASGAPCSRRSTRTTITARGYAFQIETNYRAKRAGFRIVEVPITFDDRTRGHVEDEPQDRARGGLARAAAARRAGSFDRCARSPTRRSRRRCCRRRTRRRRLHGAVVRAVQGDRARARGARRGVAEASSS